ncbi:pyridoxamine 5'-phosphate oxidase family protein [Spongiactinospora sp. TRM90649]|uniref:pyridoxamine 5'-phosphate oxidase family protein n=1 Tax=Spongiactinospora sp. TRM90649 TaxID=3031114 RepID=UPI0023FA2F51|nr:pyridoxamine 5'-phosphate oxidase family protein [Spongiactinospora sp. TRM90649]MDF5756123.1 pyridoxamine 5'-phosphate oxidase family protein [Spongiactinospora sp. TRM90649]
MTTPRALLEEYVSGGKVMQLATLTGGMPRVCTVWYQAAFRPDRLRWISRHDREHSRAIATDPNVAGVIVTIPLDTLGQNVRGVSFTGLARELPVVGADAEVHAFTERWPAAAAALDAMPTGPTRLYEVVVEAWVVFDEEHFPPPANPRQPVPAE